MPDKSEGDREIRPDLRFGIRYMLWNLLYFVPAAIAFFFMWKNSDAQGWRFWTPLGAFLTCIAFGIVFDWYRFRNYRCPTCGRTIRKPTLKQFGARTPRHYYCPVCNIEWDTGLRIPED